LLELEDRHFALCFPFLEIAVRKEKKNKEKKIDAAWRINMHAVYLQGN
jgi:hypothetical protein